MSICKKPFSVAHVSDLDIDDLATIPDYFLAVRSVEDETSGNIVYTPVRVPGVRVMPTANLANVIALTTNNTALNIPENQVRAGYLDTQPGGNIMKYAGPGNAARFLMLGAYDNGKMLIQNTGFLNIPGGHQYVVMAQYYLGENGEPVTDSTITGQKLFIPLDDHTLSINGEF